jgi:hypothetical protein
LGQVDLNKGPLKKQRIEPTVARTNSKVTKWTREPTCE